MTFKQWLEKRPYGALLSEGTIKLMESAWDASREDMAPPEPEPLGGPRGGIRD